jgi:hypothetical protein
MQPLHRRHNHLPLMEALTDPTNKNTRYFIIPVSPCLVPYLSICLSVCVYQVVVINMLFFTARCPLLLFSVSIYFSTFNGIYMYHTCTTTEHRSPWASVLTKLLTSDPGPPLFTPHPLPSLFLLLVAFFPLSCLVKSQ